MFLARFLIPGPGLLAVEKLLLPHQLGCVVPAQRVTALSRDGGNRSCAGRAIALAVNGFHYGPIMQSLRRYLTRMRGPVPVTTALNPERTAQPYREVAPLKAMNQR